MRTVTKLISIIILFSLTLYSCNFENEDAETKEKELAIKKKAGIKPGEVMISQKQFDLMGIQVGGFEKRNLKSIVKANGYLLLPPQYKATVSLFIGGVITDITIVAGDFVKEGQTLALVEHTDYIQLQEDYLKAKSTLAFLEKDYIRQKEMLAANATSEKLYQQTESNYNTSKATLISLENKLRLVGISVSDLENGTMLSKISLKSPISGYVQKINVNIGQFASPNAPLFEVLNNSKLFVDLQVYQSDIYKIREGQKIYFTIPNQANIQHEAEVFAIDKGFDNITKAIIVHTKVTSPKSPDLLPGTYVNAYVEIGDNTVNTLPNEAIITEGKTEYVFILSRTLNETEGKEYIFTMKEIKTGTSEAGFTEVFFLETIPTDARIVTKGAYYIESEKNKGEGGELD